MRGWLKRVAAWLAQPSFGLEPCRWCHSWGCHECDYQGKRPFIDMPLLLAKALPWAALFIALAVLLLNAAPNPTT